jgi:hypothetical protein
MCMMCCSHKSENIFSYCFYCFYFIDSVGFVLETVHLKILLPFIYTKFCVRLFVVARPRL